MPQPRQTSNPLPSIDGYHLTRVVAYGGFGTVYDAYRTGERIAIKVARAAGAEATRMIRHEANALERVGPPLVPGLRGVGLTLDARRPYIAMEWLSQPTLALRIQDIGGPMALAEFGVIAPELIRAVGRLHLLGFVHRDLKPEHVALDWCAGSLRVRLLDLGLAVTEAEQWARPTAVLGTSGYMPPEQIQLRTITQKADIYTLGVIMYEMLSGDLPFGGTSSAQLVDHVHTPAPRLLRCARIPREIGGVIQRCMRKDPDTRYASAMSLRTQLIRALRSNGVHHVSE